MNIQYVIINKNYFDEKNYKNYLNLLDESSNIDIPDFNKFNDHLKNILNQNSTILVIKNNINELIGSAKLIVDLKLNKRLSAIGHIEDVVIHKDYRGQGLGKKIIERLIEIAKSKNCYKIILQCSDKNTEFYEKCSFKSRGKNMELFV
tara:strand:- start:3289 stop:3732 length:444 start_codon:yes stop_codon:yes gene_type:complete